MHRTLALIVCLSVVLVACSDKSDDASDSSTTGAGPSSTKTLKVPEQYKTIQAAVDASEKGNLILVSPGVYKEAVVVETEDITIRGTDRNKVIVDGEFNLDNGFKIFSNGVAIENLTARNYKSNGVFFTGTYSDDVSKNQILTGYRTSYVTASNNGDYGIYAFNATKGVFDHSLGSGSPDAGFYIGQCNPCDALMTDDVSEGNMLGYSGTNSTGVTIVNSLFHKNRVGIVPNSENGEKLAPNAATTIIGNHIDDNNNSDAANSDKYAIGFGMGIVLGGTTNTLVERNLVTNQKNIGIVITDQPESFQPKDNKIRNNVLKGNQYDIGFGVLGADTTLHGNCFEGNTITTSYPDGLQDKAKCGGPDATMPSVAEVLGKLVAATGPHDWKTVAYPADQPNMPNPTTAPVSPARGPKMPDLAAIKTPTA